MKTLLAIIRIIVGLLFIFSGLVKANDPLGLSYKMQEFFEVWGMNFLYNYTLAFALIMNAFEIVAGVALLIGWRMRLFSWLLLLLIIFFTFLTGYALLSGKIKACGCFGECIPLTPKQSFIKDLILLALILVIFAKRNVIRPLFPGIMNGVIITVTVLFCIIFQWYVLKHLPIVDCLPYKRGNNIVEKMKLPAGFLPDSFTYVFKYTKDGKPAEFDENHIPTDTSYQFVDRVQTLVRPATGKAAISDFFLYGENGEDTTAALLSHQGYYVMLFNPDASKAAQGWSEHAKEIAGYCSQKQAPFYVVTATLDAAKQQLPPSNLVHYLKGDFTVIKTAARVNPSYIVMKDATIVAKYADADFEKVKEVMR